jgi:hypothetical protein
MISVKINICLFFKFLIDMTLMLNVVEEAVQAGGDQRQVRTS